MARYYLGLTEAQTAACSRWGSVKRHAHRALAALQHRIEGVLLSLDERQVTAALNSYSKESS